MGDRQKVLGHAGITLRRDRQMPIAACVFRSNVITDSGGR